MATEDYLWSMVLQEAAGGALDFEYLNDDKKSFIVQDDSSYSHTVPTNDIDNDCLFDDMFDFDNVFNKANKSSAGDSVAIADLLNDDDIADLADGILCTESFLLTDIKQDDSASSCSSIQYMVPPYHQPEPVAVASIADHQQYVAACAPQYTAPAMTTPSMIQPPKAEIQNLFGDLSPELMNRLLTTLANLQEQTMDDGESFTYEEDTSTFAGESAQCSEFEDDDFEDLADSSSSGSRTGPLKSSKNADRKQRKMQQNRVAAYRYRQKKKAEQDMLRGEREKLEKRNTSLKIRVQQMTQEIGYLRSLMADMKKVRSLK